MPKTHNRVRELTSTIGHEDFVLQGPVNGFSEFSSFLSGGDQVYYFLLYNGGYEIGIGTYSAGVISRDVISYSSTENNKVLLPEGQKTLFCTIPGKYVVTTTTNNSDMFIPVFDENNSLVQSSLKINGNGLDFGGIKLLPSGNILLFLNSQNQLVELDFANIGSSGGGGVDIEVDTNGSEAFVEITLDGDNIDLDYNNGKILNKPIVLGSVLNTRSDLVKIDDDGSIYLTQQEKDQGFFNPIYSSGDGISIGVDNIISNDSISVGIFGTSIGRGSSSWGFRTTVIGKNSTVFGHNSTLYGNESLLIGNNCFASGNGLLTISNKSKNNYGDFDDRGASIEIHKSGVIVFDLIDNSQSINQLDYARNSSMVKPGSIGFLVDNKIPYIFYKPVEGPAKYKYLFDEELALTKNIIVNEQGPYEYYSIDHDTNKTLIYNDIYDIDFYVSDLLGDTRVLQLGSGIITFLDGNMEVKNYDNHYKTKGQYSQVILSPVGGILVFLSGDVENA